MNGDNRMYNDIIDNDQYSDELLHVGVKRRSGRYEWGSGKEPYQHSGDFMSRVEALKKGGNSEKEIAEMLGLTTSQLRIQKSLATSERKNLLYEQATSLREKGYSLGKTAEIMGFKNDSSVRSILNEDSLKRSNEAVKTAEFLKKQID